MSIGAAPIFTGVEASSLSMSAEKAGGAVSGSATVMRFDVQSA
jgi:hypothetical protein